MINETVANLRENYQAKISKLLKIIDIQNKTLGKINKYVGTCYTSANPYVIYQNISNMISENNMKIKEIK